MLLEVVLLLLDGLLCLWGNASPSKRCAVVLSDISVLHKLHWFLLVLGWVVASVGLLAFLVDDFVLVLLVEDLWLDAGAEAVNLLGGGKLLLVLAALLDSLLFLMEASVHVDL